VPLTDVAKIELHLCVNTATATKIARRIALAELYLRNLKGDPWYDALQDADASPEKTRAEEAESAIAFYFALPHLNLRIDDDGGLLFQEWTDDGQGGRLQKVFTSMRALDQVRAEILSQAKCLVYEGPTIEYADQDKTVVLGVRDVGATTGLVFSAVTLEEVLATVTMGDPGELPGDQDQ